MPRLTLLLLFAALLPSQSNNPQDEMRRALDHFANGRIQEAAAAFDRVAQLDPRNAPQLWQRGLTLYYAGRYKDCKAQFESHKTVNPNDVENAVWHFLCTAKAESLEKAKASLLPVGPDGRVPMAQVYQMFAGKLEPEKVLTAAGRRLNSQFWAHLYIGLYYDITGDAKRAKEHIEEAANERYAQDGDFMYLIARLQLARYRQ